MVLAGLSLIGGFAGVPIFEGWHRFGDFLAPVFAPAQAILNKAREITAGSWICSADAAAKDLGYVVRVPLMERLRQTAEWYREKKWL